MELMTYKCPNCGAAIVFSSEKQQFLCESCDSTFTEEQLQQYNEMLKSAEAESTYEWDGGENGEIENVNTYSCEFCGAQIVADETTAASECPYCNNPIIMKQQLSGGNRPDCVIPFKLDKETAENALKAFYKGKRLLPKEFVTENRIKKLSGVYVPFWLFDCDVDANIVYDATRIRSWSDKNYNYTETSHFAVMRAGTLGFEKIPVDGSSKMDDAYMDAIEPFNYSELTDFNAAYLSGFLADKYDVDANASIPRANERVENSTINAFSSTVQGFGGVTVRDKNIRTSKGSVRYALMPVWMLNTKYKDKMYTFAMNGQTGKLVGELPIDKKKYWAWVLGIASAIVAVGQIAIFLL